MSAMAAGLGFVRTGGWSLLALCLAISAAPATAMQSGRQSDGARHDRAMDHHAQCLVAHRGDEVASLLDFNPGSEEFEELFAETGEDGICMEAATIMMTVRSDRLIPALRAQRYRAIYGADDPPSFGPSDRLDTSSFGNCLVSGDPATAHRLLQVGIWTPEEDWSAMMPVLQRCLASYRGRRPDRARMRGLMAEALYRRRQATSVQAASASTGKPR